MNILETLATKSAIRVVLTLLVALFIAIKFPQGVQVACSMANALEVKIQACLEE